MNFKQHYTEIVNTIDTNSEIALPKNINCIIFGYGTVGRNFANLAKRFEVNLVAFADNNCSGFCEIHKVPIISPQKIKDYSDDTFIFLGSKRPDFLQEMQEQLSSLGISNSRFIRAWMF
ncbi:MAG: hypothetical protein FWG63_00160 [Defluviitaleaceae bacterium]|nr:hypothetical protein [Defluviitaleaceae bacterium]